MSFIGNLLWLIFGGGILLGFAWLLVGCIWCITVVGIPIGIACFRIAGFAFFPFGKELVPAEMVGEKRITGTGIMNFLWCLFSGLWLAIAHVLIGIADCLTIIGIPFGLANFKIANAAFAPLGKRAVSKAVADEARSRDAKATLDAKTASTAAISGIALLVVGCATFEDTLKVANSGDAAAMYSVGKAYASGTDVGKDTAKAEEYFKEAIVHGNDKAERALVLLYMENGVTEHYDYIMSK